MKTLTTKKDLSPSFRKLLETMQWVNNGTIMGLHFSGGEPLFHPRPRIIQKIKPGAHGPRPEARCKDFTLRKEVVGCFEQIRRRRSGVVKRIVVRHGLPLNLEIEGEDRL